MADQSETTAPARLQLHLVHPYKIEVRRHPQVARLLASGYLVEQLQRLTDREVLVTLARAQDGPSV